MRQEIRFCTSTDGTRIAYATTGAGPPIVKAPNWLTHLELEWESSVWRHWLEELSLDHCLIRFDQRGCGLSDRDVEDVSFEAWVSDLEAVADATGIERFPLLGLSQGGAVAIEYAARHPGRVSHLVLVGCFARGRLKRGASPSEHFAWVALIKEGWGRDSPAYRQMFTSMFMPGATLEQMQSFNDLQRVSTTGELAARTLNAGAEIDISESVPRVTTPALLLHSREDQLCPFSEGRRLASLLPNSRLVVLDSPNHALLPDEPAWQKLLSEVRSFLATETAREFSSAPSSVSSNLRTALSAREKEVLRLLAAGRSNQQIAEELVISTSTVAKHLTSIFAKGGFTNRTEAAAYAHRSRLI